MSGWARVVPFWSTIVTASLPAGNGWCPFVL
jgi:hypothetical protein